MSLCGCKSRVIWCPLPSSTVHVHGLSHVSSSWSIWLFTTYPSIAHIQFTNHSPTIFYDYHTQSSLKNVFFALGPTVVYFFLARARCLSAGLRYLRLTRLPRHDRGPVPGGNRSAASCLCTVLRRALYHYATRSPTLLCSIRTLMHLKWFATVNTNVGDLRLVSR